MGALLGAPPIFTRQKVWFSSHIEDQFEPSPDGGTDYKWSVTFHEVNALARPLIAILTRLFGGALTAQSDTLARYLDQRDVNEQLPPL